MDQAIPTHGKFHPHPPGPLFKKKAHSIDPAGVAGLSIIIEIQYFIKCKHKRTPCHKFFLDILYQFTTHLQKTRHVFVETLAKFIGDKGTNMRYNNSIRFGKGITDTGKEHVWKRR